MFRTRIALALLTIASMTTAANAVCDPKGVFRVVSADMSPGIDKQSFAAKPKTVYRSGRFLARVEEMPDPANGMHLLIVVNAPDAWQANLFDKTGDHMVDKAKSIDVHMLVFGTDPSMGVPEEFSGIEFACEREFFASRDVVHKPYKAAGHEMTKHSITRGEWRLTMVTEVDSDIPWVLMLLKSDKVVSAIRYLSYLSRPDVDATLFAKPARIKFVEH